MDLRNWEYFAGTGNPVVGANVEVRDATLTHPNGNTILATTTTDSNGMWEFIGLTDTPKDVRLTYLGKVKWVKGLTKHSVDLAQGTVFTPPNVNLLRNGGLEAWRNTSFTLPTTPSPTAVGWRGNRGAGDVATVTRSQAQLAAGSLYALRTDYTKSAGPAYHEQVLPPSLVAALRGKTISLSLQVHQSIASSAQAVIREDGVDFVGSASGTINSFVTLSVARAVAAGAATLSVGLKLLLTGISYLDNAILVIGTVPAVFTPRGVGQEVEQVDYAMLDRIYARHFLLGAV